MQTFAEAWPDEEFVYQAGAQIPLKHNCILLEKVEDTEAQRWCIQKTRLPKIVGNVENSLSSTNGFQGFYA